MSAHCILPLPAVNICVSFPAIVISYAALPSKLQKKALDNHKNKN